MRFVIDIELTSEPVKIKESSCTWASINLEAFNYITGVEIMKLNVIQTRLQTLSQTYVTWSPTLRNRSSTDVK